MRIYNVSDYGLTVSESKNYLKLEVNDDDSLIDVLITASYEQVVAECNRYFTPTTCSMNVFSSSGDLFLSTQTVLTVSTGSLKEVDGSWYTYIDQTYSGPISFTLVQSGSKVPGNVKVAQMMLVNSFYENRLPEAIGNITSPLSFSVGALLSPYKLTKP
jgi:hypothetical protein